MTADFPNTRPTPARTRNLAVEVAYRNVEEVATLTVFEKLANDVK